MGGSIHVLLVIAIVVGEIALLGRILLLVVPRKRLD